MSFQPSLWVVPSVPIWQVDGKLCFDRKFYFGLVEYANIWPGSVHCLMYLSNSPIPDFGVVLKDPGELAFSCTTLAAGQSIQEVHLQGADIVLASGDAWSHHGVSALCQKIGAACVYIIEYTPDTRRKISILETKNPLRRLMNWLFLRKDEILRVADFELADGLQANGTPAAKAYKWVRQVHLYFDTRASRQDLIRMDELNNRLARLSKPDHRLQLAFSGRLVRMKGADHLVPIARKLVALGVDFDLYIFGAGDFEQALVQQVRRHQLEQYVHLAGVADFYEELMPKLKSQIDLFLMPHPQADPSCTYLETLSCGVPIMGYDNEAMTGLLEHASIGWAVPIGADELMAERIAQLDKDRDALAQQARHARDFASQHCFEDVFTGRIEHLKTVLAANRAARKLALQQREQARADS